MGSIVALPTKNPDEKAITVRATKTTMSLKGGISFRIFTKNSRMLRRLASILALKPEAWFFLSDGDFVLGCFLSALLSIASPQTIFSPILSCLYRQRIYRQSIYR